MNIGIMVEKIGLSQRSIYLLSECNRLIEMGHSVTIFYRDYDKIPMLVGCAMMQQYYARYFSGVLIATDQVGARFLETYPVNKKFFYLWDLEWVGKKGPWREHAEVYQGSLPLITQNDYHADIVTKCWKKPVGNMENFNHEQLIKVLAVIS